MKTKFGKFADKHAFTLIELMFVLLIIGILMSGVFMLMSVAAKHNDIARTKARIQKVQNAISGFYAAYGTYPPVELYNGTNPFGKFNSDFENGGVAADGSSLNAKACRLACHAQPVSFEFPYPQKTDKVINLLYGDAGIMGANQLYENAGSIPETSWSKIKMFKFGLMSYLLPRIEVVGAPSQGGGFSEDQPIQGFYQSKQWKANNKTSKIIGKGDVSSLLKALQSQRELENHEAAKWMPNLEHQVACFNKTLFNIPLGGGGHMADQDLDGALQARLAEAHEPVGDDNAFRGPYSKGGGSDTVLSCATVKDGWDQDLYYYSAPPYQSYRLWSAGPDGKTFPPWVPLESLSSTDRKTVAGWLEDDIVGFDR